MASAGSGGKAKAGEPYVAINAGYEDIRRLDVLVDEAALVNLTHGGREGDGEAQEAAYLQGTLEQPRERLAARILQHQHVAAVLPLKL